MSTNNLCTLLKLCSETQNHLQAKTLHSHILKTLTNPETFLLNNLITTYTKLHNLAYARNVFDTIPHPNIFSRNAILSAYSKSGNVSLMRAVFERMRARDSVSWNLLISGYAAVGRVSDAVEGYRLMVRDGRESLNRIVFSALLVLANGRVAGVEFGRMVHGHVVKFGFSECVFVGSPLVDMYAKSGLILDAKRVFDEMEVAERNVVMYNTIVMGLLRYGMVRDAVGLFWGMSERDSISWTSMITGFVRNGMEQEAIGFLKKMRLEGFGMDQFTFGSGLTACAGVMALEEGKQIHGYVIRTDYMDNVFVGSALVDMYCKCKSIKYAESVFKGMRHKNVVSWTAMVVGYGQNGYSEEAVRMFCDMQRDGVEPDDYTLGSVISSCANLASLKEGSQFHALAIASGLNPYLTVSNALVTLYGKCGNIKEAHQLFNEMKFRDEVSWTALVSGYAQFGKANETIELFERMLGLGMKPDKVTYIGVLSACSRAGLVEKGYQYFDSMVKEHGIPPCPDHYSCMIDLLSRAGRLEEAKSFINEMPCSPDIYGWASLLSSCRFHGNLEIGKWAADHLKELDPQNPASYILLSGIYAAKGKWDDVAQVRKEMREKGVKKEPGFSWIEYKGKVHLFSADDRSSPFLPQIYGKLEDLYGQIIKEGYVPDSSSVLHDVEDSVKISMLNLHSEKLAIAFGLIFVPPSLPIRIVKNLRVCGDCHNATKYISKVTGREILVRDAVRFHLFKNGTCSCGDFW